MLDMTTNQPTSTIGSALPFRLNNSSSPFHALSKQRLHSPLPLMHGSGSSSHLVSHPTARLHSPLPLSKDLGSSTHLHNPQASSPQSGFRSLASGAASPALPLLHSGLGGYRAGGLGLHSSGSLTDLTAHHSHLALQQQHGLHHSHIGHPHLNPHLHSPASHQRDTPSPSMHKINSAANLANLTHAASNTPSPNQQQQAAMSHPSVQCPNCSMQLVLGRPSQLVACPRCLQVFDPVAAGPRNAICIGCNAQLAYPPTAQYIQCPKCSTTMKAPPLEDAGPHQITASHSPDQHPSDTPGSHPADDHHTAAMMQNLPQIEHQISNGGNTVSTRSTIHSNGANHTPSRSLTNNAGRSPPSTTSPHSQSLTPSSAAPNSKKRKDANAPKAVVNAYMIFCKMRRNELKVKYPELPFGKIGAKLGEIWRQMTIEEKKPYEDRATRDRERYRKEMMSYATIGGTEHSIPAQSRRVKDDVLYEAFDDVEADIKSSQTLHKTIAAERGEYEYQSAAADQHKKRRTSNTSSYDGESNDDSADEGGALQSPHRYNDPQVQYMVNAAAAAAQSQNHADSHHPSTAGNEHQPSSQSQMPSLSISPSDEVTASALSTMSTSPRTSHHLKVEPASSAAQQSDHAESGNTTNAQHDVDAIRRNVKSSPMSNSVNALLFAAEVDGGKLQ